MTEEQPCLSHDPSQGCRMIGAMRAFHGITDGFVVLHSPPGCHSGALLMNCMPDNTSMRVVLSGLHTRDLVYGAETRALLTLNKIYNTFNPQFMVLMDCCAAGIIGEDLPAMIDMAKKEGISSKIMYFNGVGFQGLMWQGYEEALDSLVKFMVESKEKKANSINLIGFHSDDIHGHADLAEITRILNSIGISINSNIAVGVFADLFKAPQAELNVVLGGDGLKLAKSMADKFGIPYILVNYPYGFFGTLDFINTISKRLGLEMNEEFVQSERIKIKNSLERIQFYLRGLYGQPCAIIGDASKAVSLTRFLSEEVGLEIKILALTSNNLAWEERQSIVQGIVKHVLIEPDRNELQELLFTTDINLIFGSTFDKKLAYQKGSPFIRFSYPVVDKVSINDTPLAGFRGVLAWIEEIINSLFTFTSPKFKEEKI